MVVADNYNRNCERFGGLWKINEPHMLRILSMYLSPACWDEAGAIKYTYQNDYHCCFPAYRLLPSVANSNAYGNWISRALS